MKEFYDITTQEGQNPENRFQLKNYGPRRHLMTVGTPVRRGSWGERKEYISNTTYRDTRPEDYIKDFIYAIRKFKPIYEIDMFLDHHLGVYVERGNNSETFIKHIKYEVIPQLENNKDSKTHIELVNKWLGQREGKSWNQKSNHSIYLQGVNAPVQLLIDSPNASQTQEIYYTKEEIDDFLNRLQKDADNLKHDLKEELLLEIQTAKSQLKRGKSITPKIKSLLILTKEIGIGVFTNLVASPIYETLKPSIGL
ncbi:hypothetical protein [uncultured Roseivirga sp.]|uniref:hypothetical protein n=1 Tax=uncultured Roseivirga sp. TaxID=543088 RepID=UPI0030DD5D49|tara:strand:- start:2330 stop:3088 length:759 start_codon:yes stop_codon:yes gene_type:complete